VKFSNVECALGCVMDPAPRGLDRQEAAGVVVDGNAVARQRLDDGGAHPSPAPSTAAASAALTHIED
jgi:hypothetical protein